MVNVHAAVTEEGAVRFDLGDVAITGSVYEVSVQGKSSPSTLAALEYDRESGVLRSLTLFPEENLLGGLGRLTSD
ncbi:hypothetical protein [Streptomyces sp. NPDC004291]